MIMKAQLYLAYLLLEGIQYLGFFLANLFSFSFLDNLVGNGSASQHDAFRLSIIHRYKVKRSELLPCRLSILSAKVCLSYSKDVPVIFKKVFNMNFM